MFKKFHSNSSKLKIKTSMMCKNNPNFGKHFQHSEETIKKIRESLCGKNNSKIKVICKVCGKIKEFYPCDIKEGGGKVCSFKCNGVWTSKNLSGENSSRWQGGKSFEPYSLDWKESLREEVRKRDNYKCQLCSCPQEECNEKLHTHHINYNKRDCSINNLISLCRKCHTKTNINRKYWQEKLKV